ncbi:MAG: hypothetical protein QXU64_04445 [Thermofilaceae archaeon]
MAGRAERYYVTYVDASSLSEEEWRLLLGALEYCRLHDKKRSFLYKVDEDRRTVRIISPDLETARKRGFYVKKRFNLRFKVVEELPPRGSECYSDHEPSI